MKGFNNTLKIFLVIVLLAPFACNRGKENASEGDAFDNITIGPYFTGWNRTIDIAIEEDGAVEIFDKKRDAIIEYSKKINKYIINEDIENLLVNMSQQDFRYYEPKGGKSKNLNRIIRDELLIST